jgi:hypothetical protein
VFGRKTNFDAICSLYKKCLVSELSTDASCSKISLVSNICSNKFGESMSGMRGCRYYNVMCSDEAFMTCNCSGSFPTTKPTSCEQYSSQNLPFTMLAQQKVRSICNAVNRNHLSCDQCTGTGSETSVSSPCTKDPLDVLSDLCTNYQGNVNCTEWKSWCAGNAGKVRDSFCTRSLNASLIKATIGSAASVCGNVWMALVAALVASFPIMIHHLG